MRYPNFLKGNGTLGFVAPSLGCATEPYIQCFENAKNTFSKLGYHYIEGPNCSAALGIGISNTPQLCAKELNETYLNPEVDAIISCGGGEMMCEVVPFIRFDQIAASKAKWYVGYSDNTNFTFLSAVMADTAALYAPCVSDFGMETWHPAVQDTFDFITGKKDCFHNYDKWEIDKIKDEDHPLVGYNPTEPTVIKGFHLDSSNQAHFSGRLLGGCLDCLAVLCGTDFDMVKDFNERYKEDGIIWFLEACDLNVFGIRRVLWQLKNAGWFEHVKGFLIGRPGCYGEEFFGLNHYHAFTDLLDEFEVPILMDLDIGHKPPMMPMVCGGSADIVFEDNSFSIHYTFH
ncbi:MAG: LD-carboxypeptidase [Lachnospiraceae bacterium]|nr:LD-carboxypeptidase [Lachnospiraceae bacterium]